MRPTRIIPLLSVTLAVAAAVGPPAAAASGGGGGAVAAPTTPSGTGGGAAYGQAVPAPKAKRKRESTRASRRTRRSSAPRTVGQHAFPLAGAFGWGGPDARFGAKRKGHRHQGQDLTAALGTPVVAPHAGVVEAVDYQPKLAGNYVVIDSDGEDYDFVFMHLRSGSIDVVVGEHVRLGQRIAAVGSTGRSTGPHLHFEAWVGGWYVGGHPIDPLPLLKSWAS